jgi:CMP/dCMP kinase
MIITVDGEGGSGKTTTCEYFSRKLDFFHLDSGALFRWLALSLKTEGLNANLIPLAHLQHTLDSFHQRFGTSTVDHKSPPLIVQSESTGLMAHELGKCERVQTWFTVYQRTLASKMLNGNFKGVFVSGRLGGSSVFPNAEKKFYFKADALCRATRRCEQLKQCGIQDIDFEATLKTMLERDALNKTRIKDMTNESSNTIVIDTTYLTLPQLFDKFGAFL